MPDHHYSELRLHSADGTPLFAREWRPAGSAKAWVTLSHGTSEHSGRYAHVAKAFNDAGLGLVMADLCGIATGNSAALDGACTEVVPSVGPPDDG